MAKSTQTHARGAAIITALIALTAIIAVHHANHHKSLLVPPLTESTAHTAGLVKTPPAEAFPPKAILRPLAVSIKTPTHGWTSEDAKNPEVIKRIAHNPEEFKRLTEENSRIKRRQLVYRNETVPALLQRAGEKSLKAFTLPGLDGREIEVEVLETRLSGLHAGSVMGRVKGVMNSLVSVGFFNGCESFNVSLPDENYYLTADAREPGEVLVKEIDPHIYLPPTKCEPIVIK